MFSRRAFDDLTDVLAQNAFLGLLLPPWLVSVVGGRREGVGTYTDGWW